MIRKIQNKKQAKNWGKTGETPGKAVETLGKTLRNMENEKKWLGKRGDITLRESP